MIQPDVMMDLFDANKANQTNQADAKTKGSNTIHKV